MNSSARCWQPGTDHCGWAHGMDLAQINGNHASIYAQTDGLANDFVGALTQGDDGSLWIGTLHGLSHFVQGKFINYTKSDGLSSDVITALMLIRGTIFGSAPMARASTFWRLMIRHRDPFVLRKSWASGCNRRHPGRSKRRALDQLEYGNCSRAYRRSDQRCGGQKPRTPHHFLRYCGRNEDSRVQRYWPSFLLEGGRYGTLWFSTLKGVAWIDPAKLQQNVVPPLVAIKQVSVDEKNLPLNGTVKLGPGHSRFAFHYAGLSYVAPHKVRYKYRLSGFDRQWIDAGSRVLLTTQMFLQENIASMCWRPIMTASGARLPPHSAFSCSRISRKHIGSNYSARF